MATSLISPVPLGRQIRALYDEETITVYQAYSSAIAIPAVREQRLSASPAFRFTRTTRIKPSWCWMMYRSGYSYKDPGQEHILEIKMAHAHFHELLAAASVASQSPLTEEEKRRPVRVQWDPERTPALTVLPYKSIQVGLLSHEIVEKWATEWIVSIADVTERARALKEVIDQEPGCEVRDLIARGLMPREEVTQGGSDAQSTPRM